MMMSWLLSGLTYDVINVQIQWKPWIVEGLGKIANRWFLNTIKINILKYQFGQRTQYLRPWLAEGPTTPNNPYIKSFEKLMMHSKFLINWNTMAIQKRWLILENYSADFIKRQMSPKTQYGRPTTT